MLRRQKREPEPDELEVPHSNFDFLTSAEPASDGNITHADFMAGLGRLGLNNEVPQFHIINQKLGVSAVAFLKPDREVSVTRARIVTIINMSTEPAAINQKVVTDAVRELDIEDDSTQAERIDTILAANGIMSS